MASKKDMERQEDKQEITMDSLLATLDRPIDSRVSRGGYSQLSDFLQRNAARR
ncbi:hypothetical protein [Pacificimonas flava]|uniref:Uncharacterized protein n=1 Tax=Pacificimonas flava TaxID=1234595 RepID=M2U7N0_9SPHN|nr:hypothetical protein [Pacificimonas flava]EMD84003.1 hypothetical protein C725_0975 [Pacificimonas flava]MBB5281024.1 hypothetical protein [Pacificimonas flava]